MRDGRLTFYRSSLLGALLPFGLSRSHHSALVSSRFSSGISFLSFDIVALPKPGFAS